jgi:two-component system response regulator MtrA
MHILLIEDDEGIISSLSLYLTQTGFTVSVCRDGALALSMWKEVKPTLIILDINLP